MKFKMSITGDSTMKTITVRIALIVIAILVCLSAALWPAYSYNHAKAVDAGTVAVVDNNGSTIPTATKVTDSHGLRRID